MIFIQVSCSVLNGEPINIFIQASHSVFNAELFAMHMKFFLTFDGVVVCQSHCYYIRWEASQGDVERYISNQ